MPDDTTDSIEPEFSTHWQKIRTRPAGSSFLIYEIGTSASPSTNNRTYSDSHTDTHALSNTSDHEAAHSSKGPLRIASCYEELALFEEPTSLIMKNTKAIKAINRINITWILNLFICICFLRAMGSCICTESVQSNFPVTLIHELTEKHISSGTLYITVAELLYFPSGKVEPEFVWPLNYVRRYGRNRKLFFLKQAADVFAEKAISPF